MVEKLKNQALNLFKVQARKYEKTTNDNPEISKSKGKPRHQSEIEANVFGERQDNLDLDAEIHRYLGETNEASSMDILKYWHS
ncbi:hypothetical protein VP01_1241g2 [Puccinia sorghi]|uniref:Uncharacterized protein n=1 Tax=Puccinia sorghi TaxID=27349 RepID=A0A0L6VPW4_9BASI|nr:hypothetical protein VP01_1241g2 [Puccinia sorghi]